jgi:hypothetical protein
VEDGSGQGTCLANVVNNEGDKIRRPREHELIYGYSVVRVRMCDLIRSIMDLLAMVLKKTTAFSRPLPI